jgi:cyclopropane fatty-acyl-phospholipid synthase-like methyltransferase
MGVSPLARHSHFEQVAAAGLSHLMTFELVDYRVFAQQHPGEFDRLLATDGVFVMEVRVLSLCAEPVN